MAVLTGLETWTKMYLAWQEKNDPTRFNHLFIFENEAAQARHGQSAEVRQFEAAYSPELVGGVVFTDYEMILGKPSEEQWLAGKAGATASSAKKKQAAGKKAAKAKSVRGGKN